MKGKKKMKDEEKNEEKNEENKSFFGSADHFSGLYLNSNPR